MQNGNDISNDKNVEVDKKAMTLDDMNKIVSAIKVLSKKESDIDKMTEKVCKKVGINPEDSNRVRDIVISITGFKTLPKKTKEVKKDVTPEEVAKIIEKEMKKAIKTLKLSKDPIQKQGNEERKPKIEEIDDVYIVSSKDRKVKITKEQLKEFKNLYCGTKLTLNQVSYKLEIPRRDLYLIKTAFSITHDDVPFIDEEMQKKDVDELVNESLEKKKGNYFLKLQQKEIDQLRKEVEKYREKDYQIEKIHKMVLDDFREIFAKDEDPKDLILPKVENGLMLEVPMYDVHFGKLAWGEESGKNYDHKIVERDFKYVINELLSTIKGRTFEKIVFPIGQDFFNYDTIDGKTTNGTLQNNDVRWQKLFKKGIELLKYAIEELRKFGPVEVIYSPGNHDMQTSYYAVCVVEEWASNKDNVIVNSAPTTRKYVEFGNCLIGFTHGDKEKKRIFGNMQVEAAEAWGRTKYREWHSGHLHSEQTREEHGVIVRNISSITATDAWHAESGYVGAIPKLQSFVWDKNKGLREILISTLDRTNDE